MNKTEIWESVEKTDPKYMKKVKYPFEHISIDAQYQILTATKLWGSFGNEWGVRDEVFTPIPLDNENKYSIIYMATLFYPGGSFSINSDIMMYTKAKDKYKVNNDYAKKVTTDALTKGLSKLGFSADVFMGGFDGLKYEGIDSFEDPVPIEYATDEQRQSIMDWSNFFKEKNNLQIVSSLNDFWSDNKLTKEKADEVIGRAVQRSKEYGN